ncbi:dipeptide/oligopeptide/nickel ABC transporter ATP-binding protein [Pseudonocardia kongjuensis]|uniref:dipeptide/oligopeptide/nickel ABC transporter ATP-binding protein n=1 Tax=Pseudonocardia kongjuensis TaxID=102227 RepID=UPI0031DED0C9
MNPHLDVRGLTVDFAGFRAVDGVDLSVARGGSLAVVGGSGCGKSTIARCLVRLIRPTAGSIELDGLDVATLPERALRPHRRKVQMIFQDPYGSLDPHLTAGRIVAEPLALRGVRGRAERERRAAALLDRVGLPAAAAQRRPSEFSGGQRQRIGIARALASDPELLVCDEATSALDVSVQAQVLDLLRELQRDTGLTFVVIAHNLGVVRQITEHIVVLDQGRVVESGRTAEVLAAPSHEVTRRLRAAALDPSTIRGRKPRAALAGAVPAPSGGSPR